MLLLSVFIGKSRFFLISLFFALCGLNYLCNVTKWNHIPYYIYIRVTGMMGEEMLWGRGWGEVSVHYDVELKCSSYEADKMIGIGKCGGKCDFSR